MKPLEMISWLKELWNELVDYILCDRKTPNYYQDDEALKENKKKYTGDIVK